VGGEVEPATSSALSELLDFHFNNQKEPAR
jgi:hypothetical protein